MTPSPYHLVQPVTRDSCVVFASPHSGRAYPAGFLEASLLDAHSIRSSEDAFVDQLFSAAPQFGAPLLSASAPRAYVDLNRAPDEIDPALFAGARRPAANPRVTSGLGVIPRVVANGRAIYRGKLPLAEAEARLALYWHPYHERLQSLLNQSLHGFGQAILIDCHSMPREAVEGVARSTGRRPDVVLGDRFGASASAAIVNEVEAAFVAAGLRVARNSPFAGAYVAQHYGRPSRRQHAIQVEIDRSLYMDEAMIELRPDFPVFRDMMTEVVARLARIGSERSRLAAE